MNHHGKTTDQAPVAGCEDRSYHANRTVPTRASVSQEPPRRKQETEPSGRKNMAERLDVGVVAHHAKGKGADYAQIAKNLTEQCLRVVDHKRLPVRGLVLMATADWCDPGNSLSTHIRREYETRLGHPVPLIGGSMAGLYCSTHPKPLIMNGLILVAICSNDFWMTVDCLDRPHEITDEKRRVVLQEMADRLENASRSRLGTSAQRDLMGFLPGIFLDKDGNQAYFDNEFHWEVLKAFQFRYRLYGGAAANAIPPTKGYQFADDKCLESGLALAIIESDLSTGGATGHGFVPSNDTPLAVDRLVGDVSSGYDVAVLDGKPAGERLRELAKDTRLGNDRAVFGVPSEPDFDVFVLLNTHKGEADSVRFCRRLSRGDRIYFLNATPDQMMLASEGLFRQVRRSANESDVLGMKIILGLACTGRFDLYRRKRISWVEAIERVRKDYPGVPIVGGLCAGEFGVDALHRSRANNMSVSVCCLSSKLCRRARNRQLQEALLSAASLVSGCKTPHEVMETALKGAAQAGAMGGQVCIVDWAVGRIVGRHLGYAYRPPGSSHNWPAVAEQTDRDVPVHSDVHSAALPTSLREWAVWVTHPIPCGDPSDLAENEDILTLIVRCQVALFVPDSRNPVFRCERKSLNACVGPSPNTLVYLAIPLVGSSGKAIATLQISFPDGTILDRERTRLWVGYAQKVAAALERTQEAEELAIKDAISEEASHVLTAPVDTSRPWHEWFEQVCQPYVEAVRKLLKAAGTHMRVRCSAIEGDEYRLVAGDGKLDRCCRRTRPVIYPGKGSVSLDALASGGQITNTREETSKLKEGVVPVEGNEEDKAAFKNELDKTESSARLPIYEGTQLLGSFVVDYNHEYAFTERRDRIARYASELTGTVLRDRRMAYDRALLAEQQDRIIAIMAATSGADADESLRVIIGSLCEATGADLGSLYVWYDLPQKLILHVAHNWRCGREMEGKASYELGEGWTGCIPLSEDEVVQMVDPAVGEQRRCTRKYYDDMVAKDCQALPTKGDARVGIRLADGEKLTGVLTLSYWRESAKKLVENRAGVQTLTEALAPLITLAVLAARHEIVRARVGDLVDAENAAANVIIQASRPDGEWQPVVDTVREKFGVESVTLYLFDEGILRHYRASTAPGVTFPLLGDSLVPTGPMRNVVFGKQSIAIGSRNTHLFRQWPPLRDARGALLVPVVCTAGRVRGVLEFVNRIPDREHPFEEFEEYERRILCDVGRTMGAGMGYREHTESATIDLRTRLATAVKIGAASITAASVMHQILGPFARISQAIEWLRLHPDKPDNEQRLRFRRVQAACREAITAIHEAAGQGTLGAHSENVRTIVKEALRAIQPDILSTGVRLDVRNSIDAMVRVDVISVVAAIVNLLTNATDAIGESGVLEVSTELAQHGKAAIIRMRNTGPKMHHEQITQFLEPGYTTKGNERHAGLGLSVASQAFEIAGGTLELVPRPEGGVEAIVSLPLVESAEPRKEEAKGEH